MRTNVMKNEFFFQSLLFAFLIGFAFWFFAFIRTGLPGHFDPQNLFDGKGPAVLASEKYACIAPGGALKLYINSCGFIELIKNRISWAGPYFFISIFFSSEVSFWNFLVPFLISFALLMILFSRKKNSVVRS